MRRSICRSFGSHNHGASRQEHAVGVLRTLALTLSDVFELCSCFNMFSLAPIDVETLVAQYGSVSSEHNILQFDKPLTTS